MWPVPWGARPVKIGDADGQGLDAALEIGANGGDEHAELIFVGGFDADDGVGAEHVGADVEGGAAAVGRHPSRVGADGVLHRLDEFLLGIDGHFQPAGGIGHAGSVQVRAENNDLALLGGVGLHALEHRLGILQHAGALADGHLVVVRQDALVPCAVLIVGHKALVGFDIGKAEIAPIQVFLFHSDPSSPDK